MSQTTIIADPKTSEKSGRAAPSPRLRRLVAYSISSGLCPLIPIPFLDDWALNRLRRHHTSELARIHGLDLDADQISILSGTANPRQTSGCAWGCVLGSLLNSLGLIFRKLLGGLVRKILFFLALRDCANTFSSSLHELVLLDHAFDRTVPPGTEPQVRAVIDRVHSEIDTSGLAQLARGTFSGSRLLLSHGSRTLAKKLLPLYRAARRGTPADSQRLADLESRTSAEMEPLIDRLTVEIAGRSAHLEKLSELYDHNSKTVESLGRKPSHT